MINDLGKQINNIIEGLTIKFFILNDASLIGEK